MIDHFRVKFFFPHNVAVVPENLIDEGDGATHCKDRCDINCVVCHSSK